MYYVYKYLCMYVMFRYILYLCMCVITIFMYVCTHVYVYMYVCIHVHVCIYSRHTASGGEALLQESFKI